MDLTNDDILAILKIIDESGYDEVRIETGDFKMHVSKQGSAGVMQFVERPESRTPAQAKPQPTPPGAAGTSRALSASPAQREEEEIPAGLSAIRAPMLGTFYRAPSPGAKPFVEVGDKVAPHDTVCLVEVMKLFNSIKAGASGVVVKFLVENGAMVEHGQPLLLIEYELTSSVEVPD